MFIINGSEPYLNMPPANQSALDASTALDDDCQPFLTKRCAAGHWATVQYTAQHPALPHRVACTRCPAHSSAPAGLAPACTCNAGYATAWQLWYAVSGTRRCKPDAPLEVTYMDVMQVCYSYSLAHPLAPL